MHAARRHGPPVRSVINHGQDQKEELQGQASPEAAQSQGTSVTTRLVVDSNPPQGPLVVLNPTHAALARRLLTPFALLLQDQADAFLEGLQHLPPQDHIAAVKPFWETLTQEERRDLLTFPLAELTAFAASQAEAQRKQAAVEAAEALAVGRVALNFDAPLDEVFDVSLRRSKEHGTWKVWQWRAADKEFFDSESFRKYMEEELLDESLRKVGRVSHAF
jgi:Protein of unknown function (DUF629)